MELDSQESPGETKSREVELDSLRVQELCESRDGRPELPVPNSPYGLCGRKATLEREEWTAACWLKHRVCACTAINSTATFSTCLIGKSSAHRRDLAVHIKIPFLFTVGLTRVSVD